MAQTWTSSELLEAIREDGRIPDDTPDATDAKLLRLVNRQLADLYVPLVRKVRADYYVHTRERALTADRRGYALPSRAATLSVRAVFMKDGSGRIAELTPAPLGNAFAYQTSGLPTRYAIEDDQLLLLPTPNASAVSMYTNLYIKCEARPSTLVLTTACGLISAKTRVSGTEITFTVGNVGVGTFKTDLTNGDLVDWIKADPPFSTIFRSRTVSGYNSGTGVGTLTTDATSEDTYRGGANDYLCNEDESPIPQIPVELHPALTYDAIAAWFKPIDPNTSAEFSAKAEASRAEGERLLTPRQQGRQQKWRGSSLLRRGSVSSGRRGTFDDWG